MAVGEPARDLAAGKSVSNFAGRGRNRAAGLPLPVRVPGAASGGEPAAQARALDDLEVLQRVLDGLRRS
jgi:hypothetical protein